MKNRIKACVISFCILLCGCGASDTGAYLLATQETESQIPTESEVLVPDTEVVSEGKEAPLLVYVCGEVMTPGVYELAAGARVCDAVEAAGGFTKKASKDYWNLAEPLTDGQDQHQYRRGRSPYKIIRNRTDAGRGNYCIPR